MAESINPTQPIAPVPSKFPDGTQQDKQKNPKHDDDEQEKPDDNQEPPHHRLFDEYV